MKKIEAIIKPFKLEEVKDALGNAQTYSSALIYDPASDPAGTASNTDGLPVLRSGD